MNDEAALNLGYTYYDEEPPLLTNVDRMKLIT